MDIIKLTRELGAAIQQDDRYLKFQEALKNNEADAGLQELMGKLNLLQLSYQQEAQKPDADEEKMQSFGKEYGEIYQQLIQNEKMKAFEAAAQEMDGMMNYIMQILSLCARGEDPATCEPQAQHECDGDCCSSCEGGCH